MPISSWAPPNCETTPRRYATARADSPSVSIRPAEGRPSIVIVVAAWELCWYRYEIDLSDEPSGARLAAQGSELEELAPEDREANATADADGLLALRD